MANTLQLYFPQLRERQQILDDIFSRENLKTIYDTWNEQQQNYFLDICCGARGEVQKSFMHFRMIVFTEVNNKQIQG